MALPLPPPQGSPRLGPAPYPDLDELPSEPPSWLDERQNGALPPLPTFPPPGSVLGAPFGAAGATPAWNTISSSVAVAKPRHLSVPWRFALGVVWAAVIAGLGTLLNAAVLVGNPPAWFGYSYAPFIPPIMVMVAALRDARWTLLVSLAAVGSTVAVGVSDVVGDRLILGWGELALAASGLAATLATTIAWRSARRSRKAIDRGATV